LLPETRDGTALFDFLQIDVEPETVELYVIEEKRQLLGAYMLKV